jgi:hypothetical protein
MARPALMDKNRDAVGRPRWESSFLGHPDANFFSGKRGSAQRKKKAVAKKKKRRGLWKLTPLMEIRKERGIPTAA